VALTDPTTKEAAMDTTNARIIDDVRSEIASDPRIP
jgi:hypothetical protein